MKDPMLFVLANLKGSRVEVLLNSGDRYTGIFHAFVSDSMGISLRMARKANAQPSDMPLERLDLRMSDFSQIVAHDVALGGGQVRTAGGFQTDSQISGHGYVERELTAWQPSGDDLTFGALGQGQGGKHQAKWDQFQANQELYGVKDSWDENLYTTKLDSKKFTAEQRAHAAKMAREIERKESGNMHMQEERNQVMSADFADMDEEDRYGAVVGTGRSKQSRSMADSNWRTKPSGCSKAPDELKQVLKQEPSQMAPTLAQPFYPSPADMDPSIVSWGPKEAAQDASQEVVEERHRVRQLLVQERSGHTSGGSSPKGSPALSPQPSPSLRALQLDPARGVLQGDVRDEFHQFKEDEKNRKKGGGSASGVQREQVTQRLKEFSNTLNRKDSGSSSPASSPVIEPKPTSTLKPPGGGGGLNPFAKEFKLNVSATEFVPNFKKPATPPAQQQSPPAPPAQQQAGYPPQGFAPQGFPAPQFAQQQPALQVQGAMGPPMNVIEDGSEYTQEMSAYDLYAKSMDGQVSSGQLPPSHQTGAQWQAAMGMPGAPPQFVQSRPGGPPPNGVYGQAQYNPAMQYPGQQPMMQPMQYQQMQQYPQMPQNVQIRPGSHPGNPQAGRGQGQPPTHFQGAQFSMPAGQPQMQMRQ